MQVVNKRYIKIIRSAAIGVFIISSVALCGWILDVDILKRMLPGAATMKLYTAIGLLTAATSIYLQVSIKRQLKIAGLVFALVPLLTGIAFIIKLISKHTEGDGLDPLLMSPQTALSMFSLGLALILVNNTSNFAKLTSQWFFHFVTFMGFLVMVGYLYSVPSFYSLSLVTAMAFPTSLSFLMLATAASLVNYDKGITKIFIGPRVSNIIAVRLFLKMTLLIFLLGYLRLIIHRYAAVSVQFGIALMITCFVLASLFIVWRATVYITRTENEKIAAEEYFKLAIEAAPSGFIITDNLQRITLVNSAAEKMFGYNREELLGKELEVLIHKSISEDHPWNMKTYMKNPTVKYFGGSNFLYAYRKDGSAFPIELGLNPVYTNNKILVLSSVIDISERIKNEEIISQQLSELTVKNKDLEQFTYIASHDLQEPLRTVANFSEMIREDYPDKVEGNIKFYLDTIDAATSRMSILIRSLLDFSRLGRDRNISVVNCNDIVKDVIADLDSLIKKSKTQIVVEDLPIVNAYDTELRQVFQNLINNAVKFTNADVNPKIHISCLEDNGAYEFRVKDNGIGIDPKHFHRIFKIFRRLHKEEVFDGHGIGLANCHKIIQMHGGKIWVESEPGKGSTFKFTIAAS